jgi:hypothetical protein
MRDYSSCYATLGVTPDTDWETLRARYRRLIGQWHPDRFSDDTAARAIAEERSKQITLAYQALDRFRRDHGVLPPIESATRAVAERAPIPDADTTFKRPGSTAHSKTAATDATTNKLARPRQGSRHLVATALAVVIAAAYLTYQHSEMWTFSDPEPAQSAHDPNISPRARMNSENQAEPRGFSIGSTFGEVYAIQGVPSLTRGDVWHYGKSEVHFARGKVISWEEHPDNPLRGTRDQSVQSHRRYFDIGSTKDEVRAIQGTPVTETDTVWDYAPSRVYFERSRVIRWEESPLQPLRVHR